MGSCAALSYLTSAEAEAAFTTVTFFLDGLAAADRGAETLERSIMDDIRRRGWRQSAKDERASDVIIRFCGCGWQSLIFHSSMTPSRGATATCSCSALAGVPVRQAQSAGRNSCHFPRPLTLGLLGRLLHRRDLVKAEHLHEHGVPVRARVVRDVLLVRLQSLLDPVGRKREHKELKNVNAKLPS